ncbi:MAG: DNA translocase FtsK 4TM domain-containing protein [Saprospiraceae bacterium]|jgi:S-DNA-T family DNA segregation ATPase FtsK/SpoIIIE|nr:DNA translocase FtsK 4TM domain-containing protein [Saprospiraceae bacterium]
MTSRRKNKNQLALRLGINDERVPKLLGVMMMFIALYLFIAFFSYLFTWREDFDNVYNFPWQVLLNSEITMENWLGRLGAIISNAFFFWGFGMPSFVFVFLLGLFGWAMVKREPLKTHMPLLRQSLLWVLFLAVFLEFIFRDSEFPWGGAFGESVSGWMENFVGTVGMIVLFFFIIFGFVVWIINPNFNDLTPRKAVSEIKLWFNDLINRRYQTKRKTTTTESKGEVATLRPGKTQNSGVEFDKKLPQPLPDGQMAFELDKTKREKPKSLKAGESELEIEAPPTPPPPLEEIPLDAPGKPFGTPIPEIQAANQNHSEPYDPTLELSTYEHPVLALLKDYEDQKVEIDRAELEANKDQIIETLLNYKIEITKIRATIGPTVTLYEIVPAPGVRISKIKNLEDDIALSLAALGIRIIAPIPGRGTIGIEVPNKKKQIVSLKEVLMSEKFKRAKMDLPIALGKTINNEVFVADLAKMPHLLVAGATGQGKSVGINAIIMSLLYKKHPSQVKLVLIDPKKVELFPYAALNKHFLAYLPGQEEPITTETSKVIHTLNSLCIEMDTRYNLLKKAHSRNLREYNEKFISRRLNPNNGHKFLPFIVLIIDEFADLIMTAGKEVELPIGRLAQLARAVGIHLIIATQRPSVNIITGVIKANFPARIAYKVTAKVDSRTILDAGGADQLIGRGDMLLSVGGDIIRVQCAFVDTPEVEDVIKYIADQRGYPEPHYLPEFHGDDDGPSGKGGFSLSDLDDLWIDAAKLVVANQHGSTSMIQRRLKLGYNRAGRIMDQLESLGIVGPSEGSKPREVLMFSEMELERYLEDIKTRK